MHVGWRQFCTTYACWQENRSIHYILIQELQFSIDIFEADYFSYIYSKFPRFGRPVKEGHLEGIMSHFLLSRKIKLQK